MKATEQAQPLGELANYLAVWAQRSRAARMFAELLGVEVAAEIVAEAVAHERAVAREVYASEQEDREAANLLQICMGHDLPARDIAIIRQAQRLITRAAERDHNVVEALPA